MANEFSRALREGGATIIKVQSNYKGGATHNDLTSTSDAADLFQP